MGKGDPRTKRGKIYQGSFGKSRPKSPKRGKKVAAVAVARKLAVAMFAMLAHDEDYDPKRMSKQRLRRHKRAPVV